MKKSSVAAAYWRSGIKHGVKKAAYEDVGLRISRILLARRGVNIVYRLVFISLIISTPVSGDAYLYDVGSIL